MSADEDPKAGELTTQYYNWVKPTVGSSDDLWGGYLNIDLDGIDSTVKSVSTVANAAYPASNPAGYITASAIPAPYVLPTASTTILGGVKVDGSTVTAAGDGTLTSHASGGIPEAPTDGKLYSRQNSAWTPTVVPMGDNRLINGDMRIDQRNNGASGTAATTLPYTVDRWFYYGSQASKGTWGRNLNGQTGPTAFFGFPYCLGFQSSSAYAPVTADQFIFCQSIEADAVSDFMWGTAGAQPAILSFFVFSSLIGTFSGCVQNYAGTRSYPFSYSIPAAGWYKIVVTIPGDTAGTWVMSGNAGSVNVVFDLGSGSTRRGPANVWASTGYNGVTGTVSVVGTNAATFYLTGVKLEIGSVATPYNRQSLAKSMADCQRYYQSISQCGTAGYLNTAGTNVGGGSVVLPVVMRATPTAGVGTPAYGNSSTMAVSSVTVDQIRLQCSVTGAGYYFAIAAPLTLSAEL